MKAPTIEQREALARIKFSKDGKMIVEFFIEALQEANDRIVRDDDANRVRLFQGECRALRELISYLNPVS